MTAVAVVGATGNVGSALVKRLAADPGVEEIRALARRPPEWKYPKVRVATVDIADDNLAPHLEGVDVVVHLAWVFQPTHRPMETWRSNVVGSQRVFRAVAEGRVPALVYASSVGAYSPCRDDEPVDESWPTDGVPTAAYGREKAYVERVLDAFEARHPDIRVVRLRTGFVFQAAAATQQRRLFGGPLAPTPLLRLGLPPILPYPHGLRFQALHAVDAAFAYQLAAMREVRGAFNIAADPVLDGEVLAGFLGARQLPMPPRLVRSALGAAWRAHVVPAQPELFDLAMGLPIMSTERARHELRWAPAIPATDAVSEMLRGLAEGAGDRTAPLMPDSARGRAREIATGVGSRP